MSQLFLLIDKKGMERRIDVDMFNNLDSVNEYFLKGGPGNKAAHRIFNRIERSDTVVSVSVTRK